MASLYLGTGQLEQELVRKVTIACVKTRLWRAVRRMPLEENTDMRQMTGQRCRKMCVSGALRDDHSVVCSE